jgi:hypothetical protein
VQLIPLSKGIIPQLERGINGPGTGLKRGQKILETFLKNPLDIKREGW